MRQPFTRFLRDWPIRGPGALGPAGWARVEQRPESIPQVPQRLLDEARTARSPSGWPQGDGPALGKFAPGGLTLPLNEGGDDQPDLNATGDTAGRTMADRVAEFTIVCAE